MFQSKFSILFPKLWYTDHQNPSSRLGSKALRRFPIWSVHAQKVMITEHCYDFDSKTWKFQGVSYLIILSYFLSNKKYKQYKIMLKLRRIQEEIKKSGEIKQESNQLLGFHFPLEEIKQLATRDLRLEYLDFYLKSPAVFGDFIPFTNHLIVFVFVIRITNS